MFETPSDKPGFQCRRCGYCCTQHGRYAYLYLTGKDVVRLAGALNMTPQAFRKTYTRMSGGKRTVIFKNRFCPFYDNNACKVHHARPAQCATWPYWKENFRNGKIIPALRRICPGIGPDQIGTDSQKLNENILQDSHRFTENI